MESLEEFSTKKQSKEGIKKTSSMQMKIDDEIKNLDEEVELEYLLQFLQ
jgi:hypothetical protein